MTGIKAARDHDARCHARGVVAAFSEAGIATASVLAALGAAGLAIGLALQGTLQNSAAGIMLLLLPFRAGDVIEGSGAVTGAVRLRLRAWVRRADVPYAAGDLRAHARDALAAAGLALVGDTSGVGVT